MFSAHLYSHKVTGTRDPRTNSPRSNREHKNGSGPLQGDPDPFPTWTLRSRSQTAAYRPVELDLVDGGPVPAYQRVADEALHLYQLGWAFGKIAKQFGIDEKTAKKAVEWARGFILDAPPLRTVRPDAVYPRIAEEAQEIHRRGMSVGEIASYFGVSEPTARRALRFKVGRS